MVEAVEVDVAKNWLVRLPIGNPRRRSSGLNRSSSDNSGLRGESAPPTSTSASMAFSCELLAHTTNSRTDKEGHF